MTTVSNAVATQDRSAVSLVPQYQVEFSEVLPSHVDAAGFVRLAQAALRRSPDLRKAAENDPASLIFALREAARLGHEPGTDHFWLIPLSGKVEGWEGYKGVVERMYRAGAISTIKVQVVKSNDTFEYDPETMDRPRHIVDWFGERGEIIGAYAYAQMKDGTTSQVAIADKEYVGRLKTMSRGSSGQNSPWTKWPDAMWLKAAVNRLEPWVPTSSEYRREILRVEQEVAAQASALPPPAVDPTPGERIDVATGEVHEGVIVEDPPALDWPEVTPPGDAA